MPKRPVDFEADLAKLLRKTGQPVPKQRRLTNPPPPPPVIDYSQNATPDEEKRIDMIITQGKLPELENEHHWTSHRHLVKFVLVADDHVVDAVMRTVGTESFICLGRQSLNTQLFFLINFNSDSSDPKIVNPLCVTHKLNSQVSLA